LNSHDLVIVIILVSCHLLRNDLHSRKSVKLLEHLMVVLVIEFVSMVNITTGRQQG